MLRGAVINAIVIRKRIREIEENIENFDASLAKILLQLKECLKLHSNRKMCIHENRRLYKHYIKLYYYMYYILHAIY